MNYIRQCSNISSFDDFAGNRYLVRKACEHVKSGKHLILFGPTGCGKTTLCRLFKKEYEDHSVYEVNKDTYTSSKDVINNLKWFIKNKPIMMFFEKKKSRKVIFIDDYDILVNADKLLGSMISTEIIPLLTEHGIQMIITCLTDFQLKKKFQETLKEVEIIKLTYPAVKDAYVYLLQHLEGLIDGKEEQLLQLLQTYKGNIRDTLMHLDTPRNTDELLNFNYRDLSPFEIVKKVFLQPSITSSDVATLTNLDGSNIAYLLFENIPEELVKRGTDPVNLYTSLVSQFIYSAEIETFACCSTDWNLLEISSLLRLDTFRHLLNENPRTSACPSTQEGTLRFTQVLSKLSHKNIYAKKMAHIKHRSMLSTDTVLFLIDAYAKTNNSDPLKKNTEESNMITTYKKYFT